MRISLAAALCAALCVFVVVSCGSEQGSGGSEGGEEGASSNKQQQSGTPEPKGEAIKSLDEILSADDKTALAGRRVNLVGASVIEATPKGGAFLIGAEGSDDGLAVVLRPGSQPSEGGSTQSDEKSEQTPAVEVGQSVDVQGALRATPKTYDEAVRRFAMKQGQFEFAQDQDVFVLSGNVQQTDAS